MDRLENISQKIQQVDASPFLWTKIQGKIQNQKERIESTVSLWKLVGLAIIIVAINTLGILSFKKKYSPENVSLQSNEMVSLIEKTYSSIQYE
ncbi:MAG: hypothetical protein RL609_866 [Bacteroidota bacterium]|jgi:hypothetical protein